VLLVATGSPGFNRNRDRIQINDATGDGREQLDSVAQTLHSLGCRAVAAVKHTVFL
jgi:hypothetical protein